MPTNADQVKTQFIIEFYIDGKESVELKKGWTTIRIVNTIASAWPVFQIFFEMDNEVTIRDSIYGEKEISMKIFYTSDKGDKIEPPVEFKLLYLQSNLDLPAKYEMNISDPQETQRRKTCYEFLSKPAYLIMSSFVNKIWQEEEKHLTPLEYVQEIIEEKGFDTTMVSTENKNEDTVQQLIVPPMTLKSMIDYVNEKYAIYKGPMFRYVNYSGQLLMWDLKKKFEEQKDYGWTHHVKLPSYSKNKEIFELANKKASNSPTDYVVYQEAQTLHFANSLFIQHGYDVTYVIHPHEDIAKFMKKNIVKDIIPKYGLWNGTPDTKHDKETLKHRKLYFTDMKGFEKGSGYSGEYSEFPMISKMAENFKSSALVKFQIYRNIKIHKCIKVGEVLFLECPSEHEKIVGSGYDGAYLISSSELIWSHSQSDNGGENVSCTCTLTGIRTVQNKESGKPPKAPKITRTVVEQEKPPKVI